MKAYQNPFDPLNIVITQKVKEWLADKFVGINVLKIVIIEISCADGCCPNSQTKIKIEDDNNIEFLIGKPLMYIRKWDIQLLALPIKN